MNVTIIDKLKSSKALYTNADELGKIFGLKHSLINQVIRRHKQELESVSREQLHHRPIGRYKKVYLLNRQQLLMTLVFMQSNNRVSAVATEIIRIICKSPNTIRDEETAKINRQLRKAIRANDTSDELDYNKILRTRI
ncbi:hypothetical protein ACQW5G_07045 [Fructilactobacillus sp. Tb1]|uniref:hypothetical protein n=1 Tax=Fructilactobacillus sp. Tb1 TaxID=3422304 RepID=UPI003D2D1240